MGDDALTDAVADAMWERFGKHPTGPLAAWITEQDCRRLADTAMQVVREHTAAQVAAAKAEALRVGQVATVTGTVRTVEALWPDGHRRVTLDYDTRAEGLHPEPAPDGDR